MLTASTDEGTRLATTKCCTLATSLENTGNADTTVKMMVTTGTIASSVVNVRLLAICMQRSSSKRAQTIRNNAGSDVLSRVKTKSLPDCCDILCGNHTCETDTRR